MSQFMNATEITDGTADIEHAANDLAELLPEQLTPLARIAYNYLWSWTEGGDQLFASLDPTRWDLVNHNPVRMLHEADAPTLQRAANNEDLIHRAEHLLSQISMENAKAPLAGRASAQRPIAFLCAEFAVHRSLPIYAGGLGVLAGDILKEASDLALPMVGVGLLYREGYFLQRIDSDGYQHEYWHQVDPERVPAALVRNSNGDVVTVEV